MRKTFAEVDEPASVTASSYPCPVSMTAVCRDFRDSFAMCAGPNLSEVALEPSQRLAVPLDLKNHQPAWLGVAPRGSGAALAYSRCGSGRLAPNTGSFASA